MHIKTVYALLVFVLITLMPRAPAYSDANPQPISAAPAFVAELVAEGLGVVWGLSFVSDYKLIFTEQSGGLGLLDLKSGEVDRVSGLPNILFKGQGGLLDVVVPPNYLSEGWIYFTYSKESEGQGVTVLARAKLSGVRVVEFEELLVTNSGTDKYIHYGSRIAFDRKGHIFFSVGDRGLRANAQDLSNHAGSILRLNVDGSVPEDNPFVGKKEVLPEIWSYGHRNPQGLCYDHYNNRLWSIEHGPRGGDELNLILPGRNYGWPVISYGKEYWGPFSVGEGTKKDGMEQPVKQYSPSIAPGSLLLYSGDAFPEWKGNLFAGALALRHLNMILLDEEGSAIGEERLLINLNERIRALAESPKGFIFLTTDSGKIIRIRPK